MVNKKQSSDVPSVRTSTRNLAKTREKTKNTKSLKQPLDRESSSQEMNKGMLEGCQRTASNTSLPLNKNSSDKTLGKRVISSLSLVKKTHPRKSLSPYLIFLKEKRVEFTPAEERGELTASDIMRTIRQMWHEMDESEKERYKQFSLQDKIRYEKELKDRNIDNKKRKRPLGKPKKNLSTYMIFVREARKVIAEEYPDMDVLEIMKEVGRRWRSLKEADKIPLQKKADIDRIRYDREMEKYLQKTQKEAKQANRYQVYPKTNKKIKTSALEDLLKKQDSKSLSDISENIDEGTYDIKNESFSSLASDRRSSIDSLKKEEIIIPKSIDVSEKENLKPKIELISPVQDLPSHEAYLNRQQSYGLPPPSHYTNMINTNLTSPLQIYGMNRPFFKRDDMSDSWGNANRRVYSQETPSFIGVKGYENGLFIPFDNNSESTAHINFANNMLYESSPVYEEEPLGSKWNCATPTVNSYFQN